MPAPRKLDYDQARRLRKAGWTYTRIGELFDCVPETVRLALDEDAYARNRESHRRFQERKFKVVCPRCGTIRTINVYQRDPNGLCRSCWVADRHAGRITDTEARCTACGEWKPLSAFTLKRGRPRQECRACDTVRKRNWRERNHAKSAAADATAYVRRRNAA